MITAIVYGIIIAVSLTFGLFVSVNIPLIVFDKSIQIFNLLSGANFLNQIIFTKDVSWTFENIFFLIYLTIAVLAFIIGIALLMKEMIKKNFELGNKNDKPKIKWFINFFAGILIIPFAFIILNSISFLLVPLFNSFLLESNNPFSVQTITATLNYNFNKMNELNSSLNNVIELFKSKKSELINNQVLDLDVYNQILENLKLSSTQINDGIIQIKELIKKLVSEKLDDNQIKMLDEIYRINYLVYQNIDSNYIFKLDLDIIISDDEVTSSQPFLELTEKLSLLKTNNESLKQTLTSSVNYPTLSEIAWTNNFSAYKTTDITLKLTEIVFGRKIYNLYSPLIAIKGISFSAIGSIFKGTFWFILIKIFVFIPAIGVASSIMFMMIVSVMKRVFAIIALLIISPFVSVSAIEDDGEKWGIWVRKTLLKFFWIAIAALGLSLYKIVLPQLLRIGTKF